MMWCLKRTCLWSIKHIWTWLNKASRKKFLRTSCIRLGGRITFQPAYKDFVLEVTTNMGFPQGGVCSAKFWIIAFDEAAKILNTNGVNGELFADDGNGIIGGKNRGHGTKTKQSM